MTTPCAPATRSSAPTRPTAKYGIEGQLRFNGPVTDNDAAFRHAEAVSQGYEGILNQQTGANPLLTFGAHLAGSLIDPTGVALMAATEGAAGLARGALAGGEAAADAGAVAARSGWIANAGAGALNFGRVAGEGAAMNAPFVGVDAYLRHDIGDDMSMGEALQDLAVGAVFHTGVHYAGEAFGRFAGRDGSVDAPAADPGAEGLSPQSSAPPYVPDAVADLPPAASNGAWLKATDDLVGDGPVDVARHIEAARNPDTLAGLDEASAEPAIPGRWLDDATAVTPRGTDVPVRYGLVEMGDLSTSHDDNLNVNPTYPSELQPRDRGLIGAQARNHQLEQELNPKLLMGDVSAAGGAPIVSPDGVVESGNGRTIALRRSAAQGRTDAYSRYRAELEAQGYDTSGMRQPMLVRARTEPLTGAMRANLAREMNADVTERMSATEQAMVDAGRISDDDLSKPLEAGADEQAFNRSFLARVAPDQINQLVGPDGRLSPEGDRRVRAALVARAYGDPRTVAALSDPSSEAAAGLAQGFAAAAPEWARMRAMAARGDIPPDVDLTPNLNAALDLVRQAKAAGMALPRFLAERLGQTDMFSGAAIAPETEAFLRLLYRDEGFAKPREPGRVAWALKEYARQAAEVTPGPDLFGATADVTTARQILANVGERFATGDAGRIDLRAPGKALDPAAAPGAGPGGPQPEARPALVDLRQPSEERPDDGGGGLRPQGGDGAERPVDQPGADVQPEEQQVGPFYDASHAELYSLGKAVQAAGRNIEPLISRGTNLAQTMSRKMDWTDIPLTRRERAALRRGEAISGRRMLDAAQDFVRDVDDVGGPQHAEALSYYDPDKAAEASRQSAMAKIEQEDDAKPNVVEHLPDNDPVAVDPELKALAADNARLAAENGVAEEPTPETQKPQTIAAAVRAAGQCLLDAASEVLG